MASSVEAANNVKFVITGFGPFGGVPSNPTKVLVEKLAEESSSSSSSSSNIADQVIHFIQLETSAENVNANITRLQEQLDDKNSTSKDTVGTDASSEHQNASSGGNLRGTTTVVETTTATTTESSSSSSSSTTRLVLLHLGVDASSKGFKLEQCAWNDATFRIPDQRGYQPTKQKIVDDQVFEQCTKTKLDLETLLKFMTQLHPTIQTSISNDAGRYVCNYVYCKSLDAFRHRQDVTSLFLHVPPFTVVSEPDQLQYVTDLIRSITKLPPW